ncbi:MAG: ABC transporter ATP-binding protein [Candidatus Dormibacteria bacterium]
MPSILEASGLTKSFHISRTPREVLRGVNLRVEAGEFLAVMGPSGEGKSTLLHLLGGLDTPDRGTVVVDGEDITAMDEDRRTVFRRSRVGFVFQFFNLVPTLTAAENVGLPFRIAGRRGSEVNDRVGDVMRRLNLRGLQGHRPEEISGGEQQRVAIARALVTSPALLIADEPTGNLDFRTGEEVMDLLGALSGEGQTTVLATHDARAAARAHRVLVLRDGAIAAEINLGRDTSDPGPLIERLRELGL